MNKYIKKGLIFGAIAGIAVLPNIVSAASFSFGDKVSDLDYKRTIPVTLTVEEADQLSQFKASCTAAESYDVECELTFKSTAISLGYKDGLYYLIDATTTNEDGTTTTNYIPAGTYEFEATLTNTKSEKLDASAQINYTLGETTSSVKSKALSLKAAAKAEEEKSGDSTAKDISFSQGTIYPEFQSDVTEYTVYGISDTITSVKITPTCNEGACDYTLAGGTGVTTKNVSLAQGLNKISVTITSENSVSSTTYIFNVYRGKTDFNSALLKEFSVKDYDITPTFSPEVLEYQIDVPSTVNSIDALVNFKAADDNATVAKEGFDNLKTGENKATIKVTNISKDTTTTYTFTITRSSNEIINVTKYTQDAVTYTKVDGTTETMEIEKFKKQYASYYENIIAGKYKFDADGNIVKEDDLEKTTSVITKKEDSKKKKDYTLFIVIGIVTVGIAIIVVAGILLFKKKKPKKSKTVDAKQPEITIEATKEEIETKTIGEEFSKNVEDTVDVDAALRDLMSTKQYDFKDKE